MSLFAWVKLLSGLLLLLVATGIIYSLAKKFLSPQRGSIAPNDHYFSYDPQYNEVISTLDHANILVMNSEHIITHWSKGLATLTGFSFDEALGQNAHEFLQTKFPCSFDVLINALYKNDFWQGELIQKTKSGKEITVSSIWLLRRDTPDKRPLIVAINSDLTALRNTEVALRENEFRFAFALDATQTGHWDINLEDLTVSRSLQHDRIFGYETLRETWTYNDYLNHIVSEDRENVESIINASIEAHTPLCVECRIDRADGERRWVWIAGDHLPGASDARRIVGIIQDVTVRHQASDERMQLEAQLQQAQKLDSLGILAGGIAHDFNNLLAGLFGYIDIALDYTRRGLYQEITPTLRSALIVFERAKGLTQQLLTFASGGAPRRSVITLASLIAGVVDATLAESDLSVDLRLSEDLFACDVDEKQIIQALQNILLNAKEVMPPRGEVGISAENVIDSLPPGLKPGRYVKISVTDRGPGISADNMKRIFDPFFTTKEGSHGLGLSIAFSIVKRHEGTIIVDSAPGRGTTFEVYLPATAVSRTAARAESRRIDGLTGRILIMDDEPAILKVLQTLLTNRGHQVQCGANGEETVKLYRSAMNARKQFDLVILDLSIKYGMGGKETLSELKKIDPDVYAIIASGYSTDPAMSHPELFGFKATIAKPFTAEELHNVVHDGLVAKGKAPPELLAVGNL